MILKLGSKGPAVIELQNILKKLGFFSGKVDGDFGNITKNAVLAFQKKYSLVQDGIIGDKSMAILTGYLEADLNKKDVSKTPKVDYNPKIKDTDNKTLRLDSYTSGELTINRSYLDTDEYVQDYGITKPVNLVIHHTAGWDNPYNVIHAWNVDKLGRVATQYVIGGLNVDGKTLYDGEVVECFPDGYVGWHMGSVSSFEYASKLSAGIELCNFGYVTLKNGKYYTYTNKEVPQSQVVDLGYKFRGHQYWHKYSDKQLESLKKLFIHIKKIYPKIDFSGGLVKMLKDGVEPKIAFEYNANFDKGKEFGIWTHTNARKDKFDCYPCPRLVELLKSL